MIFFHYRQYHLTALKSPLGMEKKLRSYNADSYFIKSLYLMPYFYSYTLFLQQMSSFLKNVIVTRILRYRNFFPGYMATVLKNSDNWLIFI